ncbi:MAG: type II 3-dehydroquinate dehydratase [Myxococcaceae bacterium]|nr:type II 3-dehydroquinate dehydratase [Myxococcaceae bacterium]
MTLRVLVLHGPLLDLEAILGQPLPTLDQALADQGRALGLEVEAVQAVAEAELVKALLERREALRGVIVNPSSLAPTAFTLADALATLGLPCVEVQLAHEARARGRSALKRVVDKQFHGHGVDGYARALSALARDLAPPAANDDGRAGASAPRPDGSTRGLPPEPLDAAAPPALTRPDRPTGVRSSAPPARLEHEGPAAASDAAHGASGSAGDTMARGLPPPDDGAGDDGGDADDGSSLRAGGATPRDTSRADDDAGADGGDAAGGSPGPDDDSGDAATRPAPRGKTIGRARAPASPEAGALRQGKTIGRRPAETAPARAQPASPPPGALTRAQVKAHLAARLSGAVTPEAFAAWARAQWLAVQRGAATEPGHKEALEELLLLLSTTAKASDHVVLSYLAKLP